MRPARRMGEGMCLLDELASLAASSHAAALRSAVGEAEHEDTLVRVMSATVDYGLTHAVARASRVHGCGVFASHDIKQGDLITLYPCDVLKRGARICAAGRFHEQFTCLDAATRQQRYVNETTYTVDIGPSAAIIGVPGFSADPNYLGHLINDSTQLRPLDRHHRGLNARKSRGARAARAYAAESRRGANCRFRVVAGGLLTGVEAIRDVRAGAELFVSYGVGYWRCN